MSQLRTSLTFIECHVISLNNLKFVESTKYFFSFKILILPPRGIRCPGAADAALQMGQDMGKFTDRPHYNIAQKGCPFYHVSEHCNHYRIASLHPPAYPVTATVSRFPINRIAIWRRMRTEGLRSVWVKRKQRRKRLWRTATYYLHTTSEKNQEA